MKLLRESKLWRLWPKMHQNVASFQDLGHFLKLLLYFKNLKWTKSHSLKKIFKKVMHKNAIKIIEGVKIVASLAKNVASF